MNAKLFQDDYIFSKGLKYCRSSRLLHGSAAIIDKATARAPERNPNQILLLYACGETKSGALAVRRQRVVHRALAIQR